MPLSTAAPVICPPKRFLACFTLLIFLAVFPGKLPGQSPDSASTTQKRTLRSIPEIRAISRRDAGQYLEVRIQATVIFHDPLLQRTFISDGETSCFMRLSNKMLNNPPPIQIGDRIDIVGRTFDDGFFPYVIASEISATQPGEVPPPKSCTDEELMFPDTDAQWIEVRGKILSFLQFEQTPAFEIQVGGNIFRARFPATLPKADLLQRDLLHTEVRLQAVAATRYNSDWQMTERHLWVPSRGNVIRTAPEKPRGEIPGSTAAEILTRNTDPKKPVRILGTVLHFDPENGAYIRTSNGSLLVKVYLDEALQIGDQVEFLGYPLVSDLRPILKAFEVVRKGTGPEPDAVEFDPSQKPPQRLHMDLVRIRGTLLDTTRAARGWTIRVKTGDQSVDVFIGPQAKIRETFVPGAFVQTTGICTVYGPRSLRSPRPIDGILLQTRNPGDIHILSPAPWWNAKRLGWASGIASAGVLAMLLWSFLLRRKVKIQTDLIAHQIQREAIFSERERIAGDWHDTFEQQLMGISLLLDHASSLPPEKPALLEKDLQLAKRILSLCRRESRATIRDLAAISGENKDLCDAITETVTPIAQSAGIFLQIATEGPAPPAHSHVAYHLLRIITEAVANAAKHANPSQITVSLRALERTLELQVTDDGSGFGETEIPSRQSGHFGLASMDQRTRKLGGQLLIESAPNCGTCITVTLPFPSA